MLPTASSLLLLALFSTGLHAAITVVMVGDSFADAIYLGMKGQPGLSKQNDIEVVR